MYTSMALLLTSSPHSHRRSTSWSLLTRRPARCSSTSSRPSSRAESSIIRPSMVATRPAWSYTSGPCLMVLLVAPMPRRVSARTRASSSDSAKGLAM